MFQLYLEALLDGFHAVRSRPHVARSPLFAACADALVPFLARRFRDGAIVGPDLREMMLQTVSLLLQTKAFVVKFEESHDARAHLVSSSALPTSATCILELHCGCHAVSCYSCIPLQ